MENVPLSVSDAVALVNQTLDYAFPTLIIEGEISSFKINQSKFVFFDVKDDESTLGCFMMVYQLRMPLEDGMRVQVVATPKLTKWGKFSLTVRAVRPVGEGSIKKAFDILKLKLQKEGLFDPGRKRPLPMLPTDIGVISSQQAAGYQDFVTILNNRWGGMKLTLAHTSVQGMSAPRQIVRAIEYFNQLSNPPEVIVIVRGGGSADDLGAFNDEPLVRAIASSRVPTLVGVGHEDDVTLADLAADLRAATPTNAAVLLVPDKHDFINKNRSNLLNIIRVLDRELAENLEFIKSRQNSMLQSVANRFSVVSGNFIQTQRLLEQYNPIKVLEQGYALVRTSKNELVRSVANVKIGDVINIELKQDLIEAGVINVKKDNPSLQQHMQELEKLLEWFDQPDFDIEQAMEKYKQAEKLANDIELRLKAIENEITVLKHNFDQET